MIVAGCGVGCRQDETGQVTDEGTERDTCVTIPASRELFMRCKEERVVGRYLRMLQEYCTEIDSGWIEGLDQRIPESRNAFCRMVSFTAANTRRTLPVSVACVKLASWSVRRE